MEDRYLKFIVAFLIAVTVMFGAFELSNYINGSKLSALSSDLQQVQNGIQSLQLASLIGESNSSYSCAILTSSISSLSDQLSTLGAEAQASDIENTSGPQYTQLVSNLNYARIAYWLAAQKIASQCNSPLTTVLMFYAPTNCNSCVVEGNELGYLTLQYKNLSYVGVDGVFNLSVINTLNDVYNLTRSDYPAIVINGKYVVKGYRSTTQILSELCTATNISTFCSATNGTS